MRAVEVARHNEPAATMQHQFPISNPEGREYDEDYDNDNNIVPAVEAEEAGDEGDEDYDEDYDPEAEAEAIAQAMGNQIWAELGQSLDPKDQEIEGDVADENQHTIPETTETHPPKTLEMDINLNHDDPPQTTIPTSSESSTHHAPHSQHLSDSPHRPSSSPTPDPMIETIKTMLSLALSDPHVHYALMATIVPGPVANGANLYTILNQSVVEGRVNPELAQPLSILISALASGSMMIAAESSQSFTPPPLPPLQPVENSPLKRKREPADEGQAWPMHSVYNPAVHPTTTPQPVRTQQSEELLNRLQSASSDILRALDPLLVTGEPLNETGVMPVQRQLHQVYTFVSTCPQPKAEGGATDNTLQEIGGLIQLVGILSGVPIAQSVDGVTNIDASPSADPSRGGYSSRSSNNSVGTAVHPCPMCSRIFNKLSSLRSHERTHSEGRPYRCEYGGCPASFARNHDLRRHEKSHERQMFRCRGCDKLFSRRDALRRHKTNEKAPEDCREAPMDTSTVQHDGEPPRVTRVWQNHPEGGDWSRDSEIEDGEIQGDAIASARYIVGTIHATLQRHVTRGLHTDVPTGSSGEQPLESRSPPEQPPPDDPSQATTFISEAPAVASHQDIGTSNNQVDVTPPEEPLDKSAMTLPGYGLDDEHANMLERAIAVAAEAAQAQAEAEAALYEESYGDEQGDGEWDEEQDDEQELGAEAKADKLVC